MTKYFSLKEKIVLILLLLLFFIGLIWFSVEILNKFTILVPTEGGQYVEGILGQPRFINPLIISSRADYSLTKMIFNGLFSYDSNGKLVPDLTEKYEVSENGKEYTISLKKNVKWHDGEIFKADDVIFTINLVKNKDYEKLNFGNLKFDFENIDKLEKLDDFSFKIFLKEEKTDFLHSLVVGILPEHVWKEIKPDEFLLSKLNQNPIGTGPFEFVERNANGNEVYSYTLKSFKDYYKKKPFISKVVFKFYSGQESLIDAYKKGEIMAVFVDNKENLNLIVNNKNTQTKNIDKSDIFSIYFNQNKNVALAFDEVREALIISVDRNEIANKIFNDLIFPLDSPLFKDTFGFSDKNRQESFDLEKANKILEEKGWKLGDDGIRKKGSDRLEFSLSVNSSQSFYLEIAKVLQYQWKKIGVEVKIVEKNKEELKNSLEKREFDALLERNQVRFFEPDLYSLWHSKSKLNYARVKNDDLDNALMSLKKETDEGKKKELYEEIQKQIKKENLVLFLFSPKFVFVHDDNLKGTTEKKLNNVSDYYNDIENWYLKEKHIFKEK